MAQKYALVVGCNYPHTSSALGGCINDAMSVYNEILMNRMQWERSKVVLMTDNAGSRNLPTAANIKAVLNRFFSFARYNDVVLLYFAGHGTTVSAYHSSTGRDEQAIVASDSNLITSIDFRKILDGAPNGVRFIIISDSCHSGGLIDKEQEQIGPHYPQRNRVSPAVVRPRRIPFEVVLQNLSLQNSSQFARRFGSEASLIFQRNIPHGPPLHPDLGILLSACQPNETAGERMFDGKSHGVFTSALLHVLRVIRHGAMTHKGLLFQTRLSIDGEGFQTQHPCLYSNDDNSERLFLFQWYD